MTESAAPSSSADAPTDGRLLTIKEFADFWKVSTRTVHRWIDAGELPTVRIGGTVRIHSSVLVPKDQADE